MPALKNEDNRALVERAEHDAEARVLFDEYIPKLNSDLVQAIDLFRSHPVVQRALFGADYKDVTMMITPKSATQVE